MTRRNAHRPGPARTSWAQLALAGASLTLACRVEPAAPASSATPGIGVPAAVDGPAAGEPEDGVVGPPAPPRLATLGGQSGVEGGCDVRETIPDITPEQQLDGFDYRVADVLAFVEGSHTTELRWATLDPPGGGGSSNEALSMELSMAGLATARLGCGRSFEIPVTYRVRSASGALELEGVSTLTATRERAQLQAELPVASLPSWLAAASSVLNLTSGTPVFALDLALFADRTVRGSFVARGTGMCRLAEWPVAPTCADGRALDVSDPAHGQRVSELFQLIGALSIPELSLSDGTLTELSLSIESAPTTACVARSVDAAGTVRPGAIYTAPLQLRLTTADGRIDVVVPAQASARWDAGAWSQPGFFTDDRVVAPAAGFGQLALEPLGLTGRAVLWLSGGRSQGDLSIASFAPRSAALRDVINAGCISVPTTLIGQEFAGVTSEVLSGRWR